MQAAQPVNVAIAGLHLHEDDQFVVAFTLRITIALMISARNSTQCCLMSAAPACPKGRCGHHCVGFGPGRAFRRCRAPTGALAQKVNRCPAPATHDAAYSSRRAGANMPSSTPIRAVSPTGRDPAASTRRSTAHHLLSAQMEETHDAHDPTGEKRLALEEDLRRKVSEEVENHRLRVDLKLVHYALVQVPVATAAMTLSDGHREIPVQIRLHRSTGALQRPCCHACGEETSAIAIDRDGHITCDACIRQCAACMEIVCAECGVSPCPVCERENCEGCGQSCWACGARACAEHISDCPACGDAVCHSCQATCTNCGVRQCRSHLRADHVAATHAVAEWVCDACAVRCPGCQQYSAYVGVQPAPTLLARVWPPAPAVVSDVAPVFIRLSMAGLSARCLISCPHCHTLTPTTHAHNLWRNRLRRAAIGVQYVTSHSCRPRPAHRSVWTCDLRRAHRPPFCRETPVCPLCEPAAPSANVTSAASIALTPVMWPILLPRVRRAGQVTPAPRSTAPVSRSIWRLNRALQTPTW